MSDTKGEVSAKYAERTKDRYANTQDVRDDRAALVVGSDRKLNIGAGIASALREDMAVFEIDRGANFRTMSLGDIDVLVLANGFSNLNWLEKQSTPDILQTVNDNLVTSMMATRHFVHQTREMPWLKHIVFIGSMAHRSILNASSYYCAAKAGLAHFARCAAWELTPKGYRVFTVHPSNTQGTPMTEKTIDGIQRYRDISRGEAEEYWGAINLMPHWLNPANIGEVVDWLVTCESAQYLSGSDIELKAGQR